MHPRVIINNVIGIVDSVEEVFDVLSLVLLKQFIQNLAFED